MRWEILGKRDGDLIKILLKNRGIKDEKEFFQPTSPEKLTAEGVGIKKEELKKAITRLHRALKTKEKVIVYGDYDADGISATAILWEALYRYGLDVLPYIPERFSEGYGLNTESLKSLKEKYSNLGLVITVDNGIVATEAVKTANKLGVDVIITDHHEKGKVKPKAYATLHTLKIGGAGIAWVFAKEVTQVGDGLELAAIGSLADQLPLTGINRSLVKYGLELLGKTKRPGLMALFEEARIDPNTVGPYEVGFIIAPRLNAMGRLTHAIDSLRLLCTRNREKGKELAALIGKTNQERQRIVEEVISHAHEKLGDKVKESVIVLASETYHEGVIGLAAARLVEKFYRPAIVLSQKGEISKASARSISGFNIIENIRKLESLYLEGGGHPMAAGFSIETAKIEMFAKEINKLAKPLLTDEILQRKLRIDLEINFSEINRELLGKLKEFEPTGLGNPNPTFISKKVEVIEVRAVGKDGSHLKLKLKQGEKIMAAIGFGLALNNPVKPNEIIDVVYSIEDNSWNGSSSLQLKIKDLKII